MFSNKRKTKINVFHKIKEKILIRQHNDLKQSFRNLFRKWIRIQNFICTPDLNFDLKKCLLQNYIITRINLTFFCTNEQKHNAQNSLRKSPQSVMSFNYWFVSSGKTPLCTCIKRAVVHTVYQWNLIKVENLFNVKLLSNYTNKFCLNSHQFWYIEKKNFLQL